MDTLSFIFHLGLCEKTFGYLCAAPVAHSGTQQGEISPTTCRATSVQIDALAYARSINCIPGYMAHYAAVSICSLGILKKKQQHPVNRRGWRLPACLSKADRHLVNWKLMRKRLSAAFCLQPCMPAGLGDVWILQKNYLADRRTSFHGFQHKSDALKPI